MARRKKCKLIRKNGKCYRKCKGKPAHRSKCGRK